MMMQTLTCLKVGPHIAVHVRMDISEGCYLWEIIVNRDAMADIELAANMV